jgi:hypothetical protein
VLIAWVRGGGVELAGADGVPVSHAADPSIKIRDVATGTALACAALLLTAAISGEGLPNHGAVLGDRLVDLIPGVGDSAPETASAVTTGFDSAPQLPLVDVALPGAAQPAAAGTSGTPDGSNWFGVPSINPPGSGGLPGGVAPPLIPPAAPVAQAAAPLVSTVTEPVGEVVAPLAEGVAPVTGGIVEPVADAASPLLANVITPTLRTAAPVTESLEPATTALQPVTGPVARALGPTVADLASTLGLASWRDPA